MAAPSDLLSSIGICVGAAAVLALVGHKLRQPVILAYLVTGVLIGPVALNLVHDPASISTVSEMGLILLLFIIGLEIDLKKLAEAGLPVILTGFLQVPICIGLGLGFFALLGYQPGRGFASLYLAACISMSSTMIVVKLLYDKFELDTLPGRITLGVLVFQDVWAVAMLAVQPNLRDPALAPLALSFLKGVLLIIWSLSVSRYILPRLFRSAAKVPELVLVTALAWCFFLAAAASVVGLSREMGALIAGISLSTFPYNTDVIAKVTSIRDFFVTLFFVALGMEIPIPSGHLVLVALAASAFLIASRFVVVPILYTLRLGLRASLLPAINLAQISEFSIVIASLGLLRGHIDSSTVTVVVIVFAITSVTSTYLIGANHHIQHHLSAFLRRLGVPDIEGEAEPAEGPEGERSIVLLGFFRTASSILQEFELRTSRGRRDPVLDMVLVVDFNPHVVSELERRQIACIYGDISHIDTLRHSHLENAKLIVSTIPDAILRGTTNLKLLRNARAVCPAAKVIVTSDQLKHALELYEAGADYVFIPRLHSAREMARVLTVGLESGFAGLREVALDELRRRHEVLA